MLSANPQALRSEISDAGPTSPVSQATHAVAPRIGLMGLLSVPAGAVPGLGIPRRIELGERGRARTRRAVGVRFTGG